MMQLWPQDETRKVQFLQETYTVTGSSSVRKRIRTAPGEIRINTQNASTMYS